MLPGLHLLLVVHHPNASLSAEVLVEADAHRQVEEIYFPGVGADVENFVHGNPRVVVSQVGMGVASFLLLSTEGSRRPSVWVVRPVTGGHDRYLYQADQNQILLYDRNVLVSAVCCPDQEIQVPVVTDQVEPRRHGDASVAVANRARALHFDYPILRLANAFSFRPYLPL